MAKWTPEEDETLKALAADGLSAEEIARIMAGRTGSAVYGRCSTLKIALESVEHQAARNYLRDGGCLEREDLGGVVGIRWANATRSGATHSTAYCERLLTLGMIEPLPDHPHVFRLVIAERLAA